MSGVAIGHCVAECSLNFEDRVPIRSIEAKPEWTRLSVTEYRKSFWRRKRGLLYMIVSVLEMQMP